MTCRVHAFDPREGGAFRVSLTYDAPAGASKTTAQTDTYRGRFVTLVPDEQVVEAVELETTDPALRSTMTITTTLVDADGGTDVLVVYEGLPPGLPAGCRQRDRHAHGAGETRRAGRGRIAPASAGARLSVHLLMAMI